jgi:hypothetical protein
MKSSVLQKASKITFHPLIFATFPILSLFVQNMGKGYLREALLITAGALILCALLWLLVNLLVKDADRSAIIVSAFFLLFLSFGHALSAANAVLERTGLIDRWWVLVRGNAADLVWVLLWGILFAAVTFYVARRLKNVRMATDLLNIMALALVAMLGVNFLAAGGFRTFVKPHLEELTRNAPETGAASNAEIVPQGEHGVFSPIVGQDSTDGAEVPAFGHVWLETSPNEGFAPAASPDIYYIVLDMYARSDLLWRVFHYDNSEFLSFLEDKGFYIARESTSNYPVTTHSLASSLNYMYLNDVAEQVGPIQRHGLSASMIGNSRLFDYLQNQGYKIVTFATGYWFTELKDSDVYLEPTQLMWSPSEFQAGLIELTPLSKIAGVHATKDDIARRRVLYSLDHLAYATEIDAPTLVFAHINAPHDPWVFRADGRPVASKAGYTYDEFVEAYREQAIFVSRKAQQAIEEILSKSPEPPIIIVQGDHGTCYGPYEENIADRMSILNAYYFPDQGYEDLYQSITPVNTFRIVLNRFFGTDYDLLDDRSYYSSPESPYDFVDVTDEVSPGH